MTPARGRPTVALGTAARAQVAQVAQVAAETTPTPPPVFDYTSPIYGGPYKPIYDFPDVPEFDFLAPSEEDALNEPGYRFRLDESLKALQRSAAARGVLRGGGTLSGITERAQNMASAEYGNVWNRAWQEQSSEFAPQMAEWAKLMDAEQNAGDAEWQRYWDAHVYSIDDVYRRERDLLQAGL